MDVTHDRGRLRLGRLLLLASLAGIAWCAVSLFASTSSAAADERGEEGGGLLGVVGQTVTGVGEALTHTTEALEPVVTTVATVVEPVAEPLPAPVSEPAAVAVSTAMTTLDHTVSAIDTAATGLVQTTTDTAADVAQAGIVGAVAEPVVELTESLPVVGEVVEQTGLGGAVTDTADGLDGTVADVVGSPGTVGSILPEAPLDGVDPIVDALHPGSPSVPPGTPPDTDLPDADLPGAPSTEPAPVADDVSHIPAVRSADPAETGGARSGASDGTGASTSGSPSVSAQDPSVQEGPGGAPGGTSPASSGAGSGGFGAAGADPAHENPHRLFHSVTTLRTSIDDALPGAPVFDTDISPD